MNRCDMSDLSRPIPDMSRGYVLTCPDLSYRERTGEEDRSRPTYPESEPHSV
jgi:hypothetical protein